MDEVPEKGDHFLRRMGQIRPLVGAVIHLQKTLVGEDLRARRYDLRRLHGTEEGAGIYAGEDDALAAQALSGLCGLLPTRIVQGMIASSLQQFPAVQFRLSVADDVDHFISSAQFCRSSGAGKTLALTSSGSPRKYGRSFSMVFPMLLPPEVANRATFFPVQS